MQRRRARPDVLAPDRAHCVFCDPLGLPELADPDERLCESTLGLDQEALLLRRSEQPYRFAEGRLGAGVVPALQLDRTEADGRPAGTAGGARLLERVDRLAHACLGELVPAGAGGQPARDHARPADRLTAAALGGERRRLLDERGPFLTCLPEGAGKLRERDAFEVAPVHCPRERHRRLAVAHRRLGVAEPPADRREHRAGLVEAVQVVGGEDAERVVREPPGGGDVAVGVQCDLGEEDQGPPLEIARALRLRLRQHRRGLFAHGGDVGEPPGDLGGETAPLEGRLELDRPHRQRACDDERAAAQRAPRRRLERGRSLGDELRRHRAVQLGDERRRVVQVVGADVGELVRRALGDPGGEPAVVVGALRLAQRRVRDLANQPVCELEGPLARHR